MSYVIHFWERPVPSTLAEANTLHETLSATQGPSPKVFRVLADQLHRASAALFGGEEGAFEGLELEPNGGPVLSLGLHSKWLDQLHPIATREALALGLVMFDDQAATCLHPNGHLLTPEGRTPLKLDDWAPLPLEPAGTPVPPVRQARALVPTEDILQWRRERDAHPLFQVAAKAERVGDIDPSPVDLWWLQGRATRMLLPWLQQQGFEDLTRGETLRFARMTPAGLQTLTLDVGEILSSPGLTGTVVRLNYHLEAWLPADLNTALGARTQIYLEMPPHEALAWTAREAASDMTCRVRHRGDLERLLRSLRDVLTHEILPLFNACRTPAGLMACVREPERVATRLRYSPTVLALAHWEGAPDFHALFLGQWKRAQRDGAMSNAYIWTAQALRALPALFGALPRARPGP